MNYFQNIKSAIVTSGVGLKLSMGQLLQALKKRKQDVTDPEFFSFDQGISTLQFPHEKIPVPDNGRYKLHNEIDDCIVCDKCAKVCPVNCIDIVPIRSPEVFGETSDGTAKRIYAETFDIDMSKCMFCGLCTTVCPTECLTMTDDYDYSTFDIRDHLFPFGNLNDQEVKEKKEAWEKHQALKTAGATEAKPKLPSGGNKPKPMAKPTAEAGDKPKFKPRVMPKKPSAEAGGAEEKPKPKFKPRVMPKKPAATDVENTSEEKPKPKFRPRVVPKKPSSSETEISPEEKSKPKLKPRIVPKKPEASGEPDSSEQKAKPKFRPRVVPKKPKKDD